MTFKKNLRGRPVVFGLGLTVLLLLTSALRGADTLPSQIPDDAYWRFIETSSEPTGTFPSENFTSNENGFQMVLPALLQAAKTNSVYLGVGPEQNFTYIAALHPKIAFIVDIRRQNLLEHMLYKAAFEMAENRADFLAVLFARKRPAGLTDKTDVGKMLDAYLDVPPGDGNTYSKNLRAIIELLVKKHHFGLSEDDQVGIDHVYTVFNEYGPRINYSSTFPIYNGRGNNNGANFMTVMTATDPEGVQRGFLANEENYKVLRELEMKNLLIPVVGDFGGPKALRAVGRYLKEHNATVAAYYTSNVEQYLFNQNSSRGAQVINGGHNNFYDNVATLPIDESSVFIRSGVPNPGGGRGGGNGMNNSQVVSIQATLDAYNAGKINVYNDIFFIRKP
jgi:hypothetical protein